MAPKNGFCCYKFGGNAHCRHRGGIRDRALTQKKSLRCDRCVAYGAIYILPNHDHSDHPLTTHSLRLGYTPQHAPLFEDLARYTSSLQARTASTTLPIVPPPTDGPAAKKRKIQNGSSGETAQASVNLKDAPTQFYVQDISFSMPQRKKLTLEVTAGHRYLRARNQATKEVEFGVSMDQIRKSS